MADHTRLPTDDEWEYSARGDAAVNFKIIGFRLVRTLKSSLFFN